MQIINRIRVWVADYLGLVALVRDLEHRLGRERPALVVVKGKAVQ